MPTKKVRVLKYESVQEVLDSAGQATDNANDAISGLQTNDQQVQDAISEALLQSDVDPDYVSYEVGTEPDPAGAVTDDTIGAYFTSDGILIKVEWDGSEWIEIGEPISTKKYVDDKNSLSSVVNISSLKNVVPINGHSVTVANFKFAGDGFGGNYIWKENSFATVDGVNVIETSLGGYAGRWIRSDKLSEDDINLILSTPTYKTPYIITEDDVLVQDSSQQTFKTKVYLPAGRIAVGATIPVLDDGDSVSITIGDTTKVRDFEDVGLSNLSSDYFESGEVFDVATAGVYDVEVDGSSDGTLLYGIIIRVPDPYSGIVEDQGSYTHCYPVCTQHNGSYYRLHKEIYSGDSYLSIDGQPWGKIFNGTFWNEKYHYGGAIFSHPDGIVVADCEHVRPIMNVKFAPLGDFDNLTSTYEVAQATTEVTYCHGVSLDNGDVLLLTRGYDVEDGNEVNNSALLYRISNIDNIDSGSPATSHTADVIAQGSSYYPRSIYKTEDNTGKEIVCCAWGRRNSAASASGDLDWTGVAAAIFYPNEGTHGEWYTLANSPANENSALGTNASPRFSGTQASNFPQSSPSGIKVVDGADDTERYAFTGVIWEVDTFPSSAKLLTAIIDKVDEVADQGDDEAETNKYGNCQIRWLVQTGTNRYLSPGDFNPPSIPTPNSYRVEGALIWKNNDPSTDISYLIISDRRERLPINRLNEEVNLYYDWGATIFKVYEIDDPIGLSPEFTLIDRLILNGDYTSGFITQVEGAENRFIIQKAVNELHDSHRQTESIDYKIE